MVVGDPGHHFDYVWENPRATSAINRDSAVHAAVDAGHALAERVQGLLGRVPRRARLLQHAHATKEIEVRCRAHATYRLEHRPVGVLVHAELGFGDMDLGELGLAHWGWASAIHITDTTSETSSRAFSVVL